ncbi:hypothetical protein [Pontibacter sp. G13]|uniref:hypothetical protein n=1 Tax=Pontibacter sp. G13 TaxID=3074898 RepID=UPI00288A874A|nr:hypothetical protein [Pontibacter sp. G13]WNJ17956.1 hypothetical protein RJD25_24135 [Pontibacter sp. G13]
MTDFSHPNVLKNYLLKDNASIIEALRNILGAAERVEIDKEYQKVSRLIKQTAPRFKRQDIDWLEKTLKIDARIFENHPYTLSKKNSNSIHSGDANTISLPNDVGGNSTASTTGVQERILEQRIATMEEELKEKNKQIDRLLSIIEKLS